MNTLILLTHMGSEVTAELLGQFPLIIALCQLGITTHKNNNHNNNRKEEQPGVWQINTSLGVLGTKIAGCRPLFPSNDAL